MNDTDQEDLFSHDHFYLVDCPVCLNQSDYNNPEDAKVMETMIRKNVLRAAGLTPPVVRALKKVVDRYAIEMEGRVPPSLMKWMVDVLDG